MTRTLTFWSTTSLKAKLYVYSGVFRVGFELGPRFLYTPPIQSAHSPMRKTLHRETAITANFRQFQFQICASFVATPSVMEGLAAATSLQPMLRHKLVKCTVQSDTNAWHFPRRIEIRKRIRRSFAHRKD